MMFIFFRAGLDMNVGFTCIVTHKLMVHHKNMGKRDTFPNETLLILCEKYAYFYNGVALAEREKKAEGGSLKAINRKFKIVFISSYTVKSGE